MYYGCKTVVVVCAESCAFIFITSVVAMSRLCIICGQNTVFLWLKPPHHHNCFKALFPVPSEWAGPRRDLLDFIVQGKINRGRHTDHPAGRHSIRTNQCPPPPSPIFLQARCPSCHPTKRRKVQNYLALTDNIFFKTYVVHILVHCQWFTEYTHDSPVAIPDNSRQA